MLGGLLALYLLGPIVAFLVRAAGGLPAAPGLGSALLTSLYTATIATAVIALLGVPLAYLLAVGPRPAARAATALVALPLALPPLMSGLLLLYIVGPYTWLGRLFDGRLTDTAAGIVLAQTFVAAPFLVIAARAAFASVDPALREVAASLGHGALSRFWRFSVPAALPGIAAGLLLAWLRAFGEFGATVILAYHPYSLPVFTFVQFDGTGLPGTKLPIAAALGAALIVLAVVQLPLPRLRPPRRRHLGARAWAQAAAATPAAMQAPAAERPALPAPAATSAAMPPPAVAVPAAATPRFAVSARAGSFSLEIAYEGRASRLALLGPSGAGKTLTLRSLLGTHRAAHVQLALAGHELSRLASERRGIGYVPQQPALLPRRTVTEQVLLGRGAGLQEAREWIEAVGLAGLEDRYPGQLSGGQQRRVALARALAARPRLLLLDEPFSGLDTPTRRVLIERLRELQDEAACSTVLVTHEPLEAALLAEEIIVIDGGSVLQAGITAEVFRAPAGPRSAELLGIRNARRGTVLARGLLRSHGLEIRADTGSLSPGAPVLWTIDPAAVGLEAAGAALAPGAADAHEARLLRDDDLGIARELSLALGDGLRLAAHLGPGEAAPALAGEALSVALDPARIAVHRDLEQRA